MQLVDERSLPHISALEFYGSRALILELSALGPIGK